MVKITEELVRKKSEHNECIIGTLEELSLHQEDVEKIEHINNWCRDLQILYLQANLISKIENLYKLKKLEYLNLALNNIELIENLERCESLTKLDLTLNFIGNLESVRSLKNNVHLRDLYLTGNPCTDYSNYRNYVVAQLTQLDCLDNVAITKSERIKALQILKDIEPGIKLAQEDYKRSREAQKRRLSEQEDFEEVDDETFWKSKSENCPEIRAEISRRTRLARGKDKVQTKQTKAVSAYSKDGKLLNINQAKIKFRFDDSDPKVYILDIEAYKYLDTSYIDVDLQPIYVRVTIKGKIFQYVFPEEILTDKSTAKRSQITGHLVLTMPRLNYKPRSLPKPKFKELVESKSPEEIKRIEFLEVEEKKLMDFSRIVEENKRLIDQFPEVPPLEYA